MLAALSLPRRLGLAVRSQRTTATTSTCCRRGTGERAAGEEEPGSPERRVLSLSRLLRRLCQKDAKEAELERKEQGFSLYLNGANMAPPPRVKPRQASHTSQPVMSSIISESALSNCSRSSRTAGTNCTPSPLTHPPLTTHHTSLTSYLLQVAMSNIHQKCKSLHNLSHDLGITSCDTSCDEVLDVFSREVRSKTAPSKRKSWSHETVAVRTQDGHAMPVTVPGQCMVSVPFLTLMKCDVLSIYRDRYC